MSLQSITSAEALKASISSSTEPVVIGFFGDFSAASTKAKPEFESFAGDHKDHKVLYVDVATAKGAHKPYGVANVPTVVLVQGEKVLRKVQGPQTAAFYARALFPTGVSTTSATGEKKKRQKRVIVYVSDSCVWCTRVKNYLRKRQITFSEINVSRDPSAAQALRAKTGQQGVPQLDIEGTYIVGFDKTRIDQLLELTPQG